MSIGYFQWTKIGCFRWTRSGCFRRTLTHRRDDKLKAKLEKNLSKENFDYTSEFKKLYQLMSNDF